MNGSETSVKRKKKCIIYERLTNSRENEFREIDKPVMLSRVAINMFSSAFLTLVPRRRRRESPFFFSPSPLVLSNRRP